VRGRLELSALHVLQKWPNNGEDWNGQVLCWAASNGFNKVVETILDSGMNVDYNTSSDTSRPPR
jgi:hypothetical protein